MRVEPPGSHSDLRSERIGERLQTEGEIDARLRDLPGWETVDDGTVLRRTCGLPGFRTAVAFISYVVELAEATDHRPSIELRDDTVTLGLTSHSAGGLTAKELSLAARIHAREAVGSAGSTASVRRAMGSLYRSIVPCILGMALPGFLASSGSLDDSGSEAKAPASETHEGDFTERLTVTATGTLVGPEDAGRRVEVISGASLRAQGVRSLPGALQLLPGLDLYKVLLSGQDGARMGLVWRLPL